MIRVVAIIFTTAGKSQYSTWAQRRRSSSTPSTGSCWTPWTSAAWRSRSGGTWTTTTTMFLCPASRQPRPSQHRELSSHLLQTFVYLFAPICQNIRETDFDQNMRLINGRKIWSAMWEYRHPDVETFTAQVRDHHNNNQQGEQETKRYISLSLLQGETQTNHCKGPEEENQQEHRR